MPFSGPPIYPGADLAIDTAPASSVVAGDGADHGFSIREVHDGDRFVVWIVGFDRNDGDELAGLIFARLPTPMEPNLARPILQGPSRSTSPRYSTRQRPALARIDGTLRSASTCSKMKSRMPSRSPPTSAFHPRGNLVPTWRFCRQ